MTQDRETKTPHQLPGECSQGSQEGGTGALALRWGCTTSLLYTSGQGLRMEASHDESKVDKTAEAEEFRGRVTGCVGLKQREDRES